MVTLAEPIRRISTGSYIAAVAISDLNSEAQAEQLIAWGNSTAGGSTTVERDANGVPERAVVRLVLAPPPSGVTVGNYLTQQRGEIKMLIAEYLRRANERNGTVVGGTSAGDPL